MAFERREFLKASAAFAAASAAGGFSCVEIASAAPITPPVIDRLSIRVLVDGSNNLFLRPGEVKGVKIEPPPRGDDYRRAIHNQWGLSLYVQSQRASEERTFMIDFGYTPEAVINNMEITGADPKKIEALVVSHGHFDHFGGLIGFLDKYRGVLPADLTLYAGGEDNFCHRYQAGPGALCRLRHARSPRARQAQRQNGAGGKSHRDRPRLHHRQDHAQLGREGVAQHPRRVRDEGRARLQRQPLLAGRAGWQDRARRAHPRARDLLQREGPRPRRGELLRSCRDRQFGATGTGGFRRAEGACAGRRLPSGPAPADYLNQVMAEIKKLDPDVIIPMHCSGENFIRAVREQMPDKLLVSYNGAHLTFGA